MIKRPLIVGASISFSLEVIRNHKGEHARRQGIWVTAFTQTGDRPFLDRILARRTHPHPRHILREERAAAPNARPPPALRPEAQPVHFDFDPSASPVQQVESVLAAIAEGDVPVDLGKQLIDAIKALADVRATEELEARLVALEARQQ